MRTIGAAVLGVVAGLLAGFLIFDGLLSRLLVAAGADIGVGLGLVIGYGPVVLAVAGAVVAVGIDQRRRARTGRP